MFNHAKKWMVDRIRAFLGSRGYNIVKAQFHQEEEIDLRRLLARSIAGDGRALTVIQVGANDGITNDPIHDAVLECGWRLVTVEPMPAPFARLTQTYHGQPNVSCVNAAVGLCDGQADIFFVAPRPGDAHPVDQLSGFSREVLRQHWRNVPDLESRIRSSRVRTVTLRTLMSEHDLASIDMLQIDAEGFDYDIVKMAFASGIVPPILAFEWDHLGQKAMWDCRCDLIKHGYRWLVVKGDVIAAQPSVLKWSCGAPP